MKALTKAGAVFYVLLLASTVLAIAQINYGTLRGTVSDPSGGVVPGADVTATDPSTAAQYKSVTNADGAYAILELPLGTYTLSAHKEGFETATQSGVTMNAGDNKTIDISLKVGSATEKVEVTGAPPALETTTGSYNQSEDADALIQLPLAVSGAPRNVANYLSVFPGYQGSAGFENNINGAVGAYSEVYVDGSTLLGSSAVHGLIRNPFSPEAVAELKVIQTPMGDAGNTGGVAISYITKSGTNMVHGAGYIYQKNTAFDSRAEFASVAARDQQGEYGFDLGGPVYIPKVYDGRNKTFWWFNYGWFHYADSASATFFGMPTDAWKAGNFADQLGAQIGTDDLGRPVLAGQVYNPLSTRTLADGTVIRDPFAGNVVPNALFSTVSSNFQTYFPEPNRAGDPPNNYFVDAGQGVVPSGSVPQKYWEINIDQNIGNKDHIKGAYWNFSAHNTSPEQLPLFFLVTQNTQNRANDVHLNWTHTFNPSLVHVLAAGFDRFIQNNSGNPLSDNGATLVGQPNALQPCTPGVGIPNINATSRGDYSACRESEGDTNFAINDNWTKSYGHHLTKWGFNLYRYNANFPSIWNLGAGFLAGETAIPNQPGCANCLNTTGVPYASFLMGAIHDANVQGIVFSSPRSLGFGFYVGDEYRVTPKLTLTFGLRYDAQPMPIEARGRTSQFSFTRPNPAAGGIPGAMTFGGFGPGTLNTKQLAPSEYLTANFAPKFSFAYQFRNTWVLRGAYVMNYGPPDQTNEGFQTSFQQGYFPNFTAVTTDGYTPAYFWDNGFPFPPGVPLYNNFDPTLENGSATGYYGATSDHSPRVQNIHVDIEHELPGRIVISMNYNATIAHGIINGGGTPANQLNYGTYSNLSDLLTDDINSPAARAANIPIPYAGFVGSVAQALRPFPQYGDIENQSATNGFSNYNAGQVQASKSYSNGLSFLVGYTFMKEFSNMNGVPGAFSSEPQDAYNLRAEKQVYYADLPQQVLFNYTYELPAGRGKHFNIDNRGLDAIAGGWSVAGVHTYQSGSIINPTTNQTLPTVTNPLRPDVVPGQPIRTNVSCSSFNPATDVYLNAAAFTDPAPFAFGNARNAFDHVFSCPSLNESISAFKTFSFTEGIKFKIGADFFNAFNRHQWSVPNSDIDSGAYGVITSEANSPRSIQLNGRLTF